MPKLLLYEGIINWDEFPQDDEKSYVEADYFCKLLNITVKTKIQYQ